MTRTSLLQWLRTSSCLNSCFCASLLSRTGRPAQHQLISVHFPLLLICKSSAGTYSFSSMNNLSHSLPFVVWDSLESMGRMVLSISTPSHHLHSPCGHVFIILHCRGLTWHSSEVLHHQLFMGSLCIFRMPSFSALWESGPGCKKSCFLYPLGFSPLASTVPPPPASSTLLSYPPYLSCL